MVDLCTAVPTGDVVRAETSFPCSVPFSVALAPGFSVSSRRRYLSCARAFSPSFLLLSRIFLRFMWPSRPLHLPSSVPPLPVDGLTHAALT